MNTVIDSDVFLVEYENMNMHGRIMGKEARVGV